MTTIAPNTAKPTRRQTLAVAEYLCGLDQSGRRRLTQREIAEKFGVQRSTISKRMAAYKATLAGEALVRYEAALSARRGKKHRMVAMQLNFMDAV